MTEPDPWTTAAPAGGLGWRTLPVPAQIYVAAVIVAGAVALAVVFPLPFPQPALFSLLLLLACVMSSWKVNLPISRESSSTLSVSCAANLMSLLLLGPRHAVIIAAAGAWTQCTYRVKEPYPLHRTVFSVAAEGITMTATGLMYQSLGGLAAPFEATGLAKPLVGAIAMYFVLNTGLIAAAIALSAGRTFLTVWRDDFMWSGASFMVSGSAGALGAIVVDRGEHWKAALMLAPIYLTYRTYEVFVGRLEDQKHHLAETRRLHDETVQALLQAREAERALAQEKERLAVTLIDMTRLEEARNQLLEREQAARTSAEEANRLKDEFLAMVSHELRTPLNAILGWSDMLRSGRLHDARRERAVQAIFDSAKRQAELVEELLDIAAIMSRKLRLERTVVDLQDVARGAVQVVQPIADAKQIHIALEVDSSVGAVYGDSARLQQIAWNLLSNAIKFTPERGVVHMRLHRAGDRNEMIVSDSGQGISREFLPSVFEPFRQADGSTTRVHGGLGLGLSIVKHLVEVHGGTVSAHSAGEGRGATFVVSLPIVAFTDSTETASRAPRSAATPLLEGISVLVVDDDAESREVVAAHLESEHAEVLIAESAAQALDMLQREHVDVLLADIAMPGEDGYALIRKLRALDAAATAAIPAAALTARARDEDRQLALRAGFQLHLAKPIDAHSLAVAVASLSKPLPA